MPADWYEDPYDHSQLRWWDGIAWSDLVERRTDWPGRRPPPVVEPMRFAEIGPEQEHRPYLDEVRFRDP